MISHSLRAFLRNATLFAVTLSALFVTPTMAQPGGDRPEPPKFIAPTYRDKPIWMRYEERPAEPLSSVERRLQRYKDQTFAVDTLRYSGAGAIDIVVFGDGYTQSEQEKFTKDARQCTDHLFETSPFDGYTEFFNVYAVHVVSEETGISHPGQWKADTTLAEGGTMVCPEHSTMPIERRNTFFGASLDGWGVHRIIGAWNEQAAQDLLRVNFPHATLACILCNTDEYGGAGGKTLICTTNSASAEIFVHEMAHTFANLADEYFGGDAYMGENPNLTNVSDSTRIRWARWLDEPEVGIYPHNGGRTGKYYFKPTQASNDSRYCKMERLDKEFCPVCRERLIEAIHEQASFVIQASPADTILAPVKSRHGLTFSVDKMRRPQLSTLHVRWLLDGKVIAEDVEQVTLTRSQLPRTEQHEVVVEIYDENSLVRNPTCAKYHTQRHTWHIARK